MVKLLLGQRREGGINDHPFASCLLEQALGPQLIALFLDMAEIICMELQVRETLLETVQDDIVLINTARNLVMLVYRNGLGNLILFLNHISEGFTRYIRLAILVVV